MKKVDERDIMFARMSYEKGSPQYEDYYSRHPEKKEIDDELRAMPHMGGIGTVTYDVVNSPIVDACFNFLGDIKKYAEGNAKSEQVKVDAETMTKRLKGLAKFYNAKLVGITEMKDYHYYSHRGRNAETYGDKIEKFHKYGIVFAVEMDRDMIYRAPQLPESIAVTKGYIDTTVLGMVLSYYIRELGYDARNHMDGNYLVIAPLVAKDAGLGELGRNGILVTKEYGQMIRLGVVTTDMPLICDEEEEFGLEQFCLECGKCAQTCPGKAISKEHKGIIDGVKRWQINSEECYRRWRSLGTDCGICLSNCSFSDGIPLELVNRIKESKEARDEILRIHKEKYGIRPYIREKPEWLE